MTALTLYLPDELVQKAQQIGILKPDMLSEYVRQFLEEQIQQQHYMTNISAFSGLVKAKSTGQKRSLDDFNAANFVNDSL